MMSLLSMNTLLSKLKCLFTNDVVVWDNTCLPFLEIEDCGETL